MKREIKNTEQQIAKWFKARKKKYGHDEINKEPLSSYKKHALVERLVFDYCDKIGWDYDPLNSVDVPRGVRVMLFLEYLDTNIAFLHYENHGYEENQKEIICIGELAWYSDYEEVIEDALIQTYEADLDALNDARLEVELKIKEMTSTGQCRHDEVVSPRTYYSVKEVADILDVNPRAIQKRCVRANLKLVNGVYMIPVDVFQKWIDKLARTKRLAN